MGDMFCNICFVLCDMYRGNEEDLGAEPDEEEVEQDQDEPGTALGRGRWVIAKPIKEPKSRPGETRPRCVLFSKFWVYSCGIHVVAYILWHTCCGIRVVANMF